MLRSVSFFLLLLPLLSLAQEGQRVAFHINGLEDTTAVVGYYFGDKRYVVDTLQGSGGDFYLQAGEQLTSGLYFLYSANYYLEFVMDTTDFTLNAVKGKGYSAITTQGSGENGIFKKFRVRLEQLQRQQQEQMALLKSGSQADSLNARTALDRLDKQVTVLRDSIISDHPGSFTSAFIGLMHDPEIHSYDQIADENARSLARYNWYREHYLDAVALGDPRLLRTPLLHGKVMKYFEQVVPNHPDSLIKEVDRLFREIGENDELFRYWLVTLFQHYEKSNIMGMDAVTIHLIERYYLSGRADWISEEFRKKLREEVAFVKPNLIGKPAPTLQVVDTLLQPVYLEQIEVPYLVLYFYDPDCGHCKKATGALREEYDKLRELDAEVLGVCTVTDVQKWKDYLKKNELPWLHAADPSGDSRFRVTYDIRSTPRIYILGPDRRIIAKHLEVTQLAEVIRKMRM